MEINVGDYVRTNLGIGTVHRFYNDNGYCYVRFSKNVIKIELYLGNIEIKGILTHEQFEERSYKV